MTVCCPEIQRDIVPIDNLGKKRLNRPKCPRLLYGLTNFSPESEHNLYKISDTLMLMLDYNCDFVSFDLLLVLLLMLLLIPLSFALYLEVVRCTAFFVGVACGRYSDILLARCRIRRAGNNGKLQPLPKQHLQVCDFESNQ